MKKKIGIGVGLLFVLILAIVGIRNLMAEKNNAQEEVEDLYGIEYYTVPDMEQVFINGVVKPEQSQEFQKEELLGEMGNLQVENGETVEEGTLLYTYENKEIAAQIIDMQNQAKRMETQKTNADNKQALAIKIWNNTPEEERMETLEEIKMNMSTSDMKAEINELYNTVESLKEEQYTNVTAPFKGKVYIPEEKDANTALLKLISDNFYVSGTVNERDVEKLAIDQLADIKMLSTDQTITGKVSFIDPNPTGESSEVASYGMGGGEDSTMSNYPIKLTLDSLEGVRNGYHVQAVINLGDLDVKIPTEAIHEEDEEYYVLVNDFGTVVRRVIQLGEEEGDTTTVTSGLEAEDQIIVSSQEPIIEGQVLSESSEMMIDEIDSPDDDPVEGSDSSDIEEEPIDETTEEE